MGAEQRAHDGAVTSPAREARAAEIDLAIPYSGATLENWTRVFRGCGARYKFLRRSQK
jgi:hypothetical protein